MDAADLEELPSIFAFRARRTERTAAFNAVMLIPTGIDCAIGGHAGDATPAARLLASVCDRLILHPNVVNASDINEQPENALYVEGSLISRFMMGSIALRRVRANRILVVTEPRPDYPWIVDQVVNSANAARATLGVECTKVVILPEPLSMTMTTSTSGRAAGEIGGIGALFEVLRSEAGTYDAVALATKITPPGNATALFEKYFRGDGPNPWGGVEASLTHAISSALNIPSAHAPTMEERSIRATELGRVAPRKAAEAISTSYMFCLLKGLHRAPAVVTESDGNYEPDVLSAEDISCLVIPEGVIGIPTIAAVMQGIPTIVVRGNSNLMRNDVARLPFATGQLTMVDNYAEAAGVMQAMKIGLSPHSLRRPLPPVPVGERA